MKVSIIMPVYNEATTIAEMIDKVQAVDLGCPKEVIIVDDASVDGTKAIIHPKPGILKPAGLNFSGDSWVFGGYWAAY